MSGNLPGSRLSDLQPFWRRVRARAGLKDARIHDLQNTFASAAVKAGRTADLGKLLGHTQVSAAIARGYFGKNEARRQTSNEGSGSGGNIGT